MKLNDIQVSRAIIDRYFEKLNDNLECDVIIAGAGPASLTAAYYLASAGIKTVIYERKLSIGGGMWGGGMMFNEIVVQESSCAILDRIGITTRPYGNGYHTADAVEAVTTLCSQAIKAGATIFNCMSIEDVRVQDQRVTGAVINWSAVDVAGLHVDPITVGCRYLVEATGHPLEVAQVIARKSGGKLMTPSGGIEGEKSMDADRGEPAVVENTKEIYPGVYVAGMAANAVFGAPRMGPIFGGMLLSGKKVAETLIDRLHE